MCRGNFVLCKENNINLPGIALVSSSYEPFFVRFKISEIGAGLLFMASINWSHIIKVHKGSFDVHKLSSLRE
jgi:uncharacterized protein YbbC (DUF1343 family)